MMAPHMPKPDPRLDLVLERVVDVPRELVWKAWTTPQHLMTVVHAGAVEDHRLHDRPAPGRPVLYGCAVT